MRYVYICDCNPNAVTEEERDKPGPARPVEVDKDECCKLCGYQAVVQNIVKEKK